MLEVDFLGIPLKNPLIVASGPMTRCGSYMKRAVEAGAGAVVTETIVNEVRRNVRPRLAKKGAGLQNIRLYSDYSLEEWAHEISIVKDTGGVCIANILGHTPSEMAYIAGFVEKAGADTLELNIASPHGEGLEVLSADPEQVYEFVRSTVKNVSIPVTVKLSPNVSNIVTLAQAAERAGAAGVSAINTMRSIIGVDIETGKPLLPTFGGYSGDPIRPVGLATTATLAQAVSLPVSGIGGISTSEHVLEYIMLGASTVQILTALILNGYAILRQILKDLEVWLETKGYSSLEEIRGTALKELKSFEEIPNEPYTSHLAKPCLLPDCSLCTTSCMYDAISKDHRGVVSVDQELCSGCGLCVTVCPARCFELRWDG